MRYPDTVNLPFNATLLGDEFIRGLPDQLPQGDGPYAVLMGGSLVVEEIDGVCSLPRRLPAGWKSKSREPLFIGYWRGEPLRILRIGKDTVVEPPYSVEPFNAVKERLDDSLLTIGGLAQQILHWERLSRLCARCGVHTSRVRGTWGKQCPACGHEQYPAIHPCAIVLVKRHDEFLLIRKATWPEGRYSLVAGFLDFGESLEECAVREVREETGVTVSNVRYVGSQNWPFPSQLMAGFVADYAGGEIVVDTSELEDARWFSPSSLPGGFPPHRSIARWIIERFALQHQEDLP
ncbi:MAG: NAD(+) diphosphatase [Geobacter sp.]|nr:NAD(+) diphosphatase [Geobacter sp.]